MQNVSGLAIEITLASPGVFRVIERSSGASSAIHKVAFDEHELDALVAETHRILFAVNTNHDLPASSFRRLGAQIAALVLPREIYGKVEQAIDTVEFYLDDYSLKIPVEVLPCQDSVLAIKVPLVRHWLYEASNATLAKNDIADEKSAKNALIVADPVGDLPSAATEGQSVMRFLKEKKTQWRCRYLGHLVTADALTHELPDTELLHIAAHYHDGSEKEEHGIAMSDGYWLPNRIPHTPDIVFLNCCRAGQIRNDYESQSLIGKFLQQGTQHVIAPLLPTSDVIAKRFADEFYAVFDTPDTVAESVFKARQALGAAGLLYVHYGTQTDGEGFSTRRAASKYRGLLLTALLVAGCASLAAIATVEYQKHRSAQEMEQQLAGVRFQAAQETERQLNDLRLHSTREMERQLEETRRKSAEEMERQFAETRRQSDAEMQRRLVEARRQSARETEQQLETMRGQSAQETERRLSAMRLESTKEMERQLEETRRQSAQETERLLQETRLQSEQETERRLEQMRLQSERELERRLDDVRQQSAQETTQQIEGERTRTKSKEEELLEQERLKAVARIIDNLYVTDVLRADMIPAIMGEAATAGDIPVMAMVLARSWPINGFDRQGMTAFAYAVDAGQIDAMEWLKEQGADINKYNKNQSVPLHIAVFARAFPVMEWLHNNGVDVNVQDANGNTAMMYAAYKNFVDVMQWLYDHGAKVDDISHGGRSPLSLAEEQGNTEAIQWIKEALAARTTETE